MSTTLELGSAVVPLHAGLGLVQEIAPFGGYSVLRLLSGAARRQTQWQKRRVSFTASGWVPPGLQLLDYSQVLTLKCPLPTGLVGATTTIALPTDRRTDSGHVPLGYAYVSNNWTPTTCSITDHVATLGSVSGATAYRVLYWLQMSVVAEPPQESMDGARAEWRWTLRAEEA